MKFKELKIKKDKELRADLLNMRENLQAVKFKVAAKQMKDVREIRTMKKQIAQIMTLLKQREKEIKTKEN